MRICGAVSGYRPPGWSRIPKPTRVLEPTYTLEAAQDGERTVTVRRVGGAPVLIAGYHVMPSASPPRCYRSQ